MAKPQAAESRKPGEKDNMGKKKPVREILLAALLAALVFTAGIFGLQMTTGGIDWLPFGGKNPIRLQDGAQSRQPLVSQLTAPVFIASSNGDGIFYPVGAESDLSMKTNGSSTAGRILMIAVKDYLSKSTVAEKITHDQFRETASAETVTAQYSCGIPFEAFLDDHRLKVPSGSTVSYLSRLTLSALDGGTVYLYDGESDQYYRIKRNNGSSDVLTSDFVKGLAETISENAGRTLYCSDIAWAGSHNLLPEDPAGSEETTQTTVPQSHDFSPEYDLADPGDLKALESLFFPEGMDFIQKVTTSDGSLIYMYGSMEKMLRVDSGGGITYIQEKTKRNPMEKLKFFSPPPDFYESLALAVEYVTEHGGWPSDINDNTIVRLAEAESIEKKSGNAASDTITGYRFIFSLEIAGFPLSYQYGSQLSVDIYGKDISLYHRDLPDLSGIPAKDPHGNGASEPRDSDNTMQNSTTPDSASPNDPGESGSPSAEEKSAFFSDGGTALNLASVLQINHVLLSDALIADDTEQQDNLSENREAVTAEDILRQLSEADLRLLRLDTADNPSGSPASNNTGVGSTENEDSSINSFVAASQKGNGNWVLAPAWKLRIGNKTFWFQALTGTLLLNG